MRVHVKKDWQGFEIDLNTPLKKMVAQYIFGESDYQDEGRDIARILSKDLDTSFSRVYETTQKLEFCCSPETAPAVRQAFATILQYFKTIEFVTPEFTKEICDRAKQDHAPKPAATNAPKP